MPKRYCIKPSYQASLRTESYDPEASQAYWTPERIQGSNAYQHHVYQACRRLMIQTNCQSLLEIGCGPALKTARLLAPLASQVTLIDQPSVEAIALQNVPRARFLGTNLEESAVDLGQTFDVVLCADVVEHLVDPDPCLQLIRRNMNPDGYAVISTPERDVLHGVGCNQSYHQAHIREWNRPEFANWLSSHGLAIVEHVLLPQLKLSAAEFAASRLLKKIVPGARWFGCQMAIVQQSN